MDSSARQRAYGRRVSQKDELEESRTRHEQFRSSMFTSTIRSNTVLPSSAGASTDSDSNTTSRIDAAIAAAMAVDAQRGVNTFSRMSITPNHSGNSSVFRQYGGNEPNGSVPHSSYPSGTPSAGTNGSPTPYLSSYLSNGVAGGSRDSNYLGRAGDATGDPVRSRNGSRNNAIGADDRGSGGGGEMFANNGDEAGERSGGTRADWSGSGGGRVGRVGSDDRMRGVGADRQKSTWEPGGESNAHKGVRQADIGAPRGGSGEMGDEGVDRGTYRASPSLNKRDPGSSHSGGAIRREVAGREAIPPPDHARDSLTVDGGIGDSACEHEGGGGGVALTPKGYNEPLELPDGCHHISLTKFLEVMTGPGLRVRKHHRAGKGSSGLRVLRYNEDEDSLTWDSHKILGAAQHVLPMIDVQATSMQAGNRVVLTCVGGKDSYAVFEAANEDAAAVLYVGIERLRERSSAQ